MSKKKTTAEFILEAKLIHGDKYDYSKVLYKNNKEKVYIICPIHGEFWKIAKEHLNGLGCPECSKINRGLKRRNTTEYFINKSKSIYGNKYDYSYTKYVDFYTPVTIVCPIHGEFLQTPKQHYRGGGCPHCSLLKLTSLDIINKSIQIHGNKYDLFIEYNGKLHYIPIEYFGGEDKFKKQRERDNYVRKYAVDNNVELIEIPYIVDNLEKCLNYIFSNMDNIKIVKQTLYTQWVDQTTGELFEETREFLDDTIKVPKKTANKSSKKPKDTDTEPKVYLEDNKVRLNGKTVELTGFEPEQKINILFEKKGKTITPILCLDDKNGNRLTKTYTISCRGSRHDNLAGYGDTFEVIPYEGKEGYFKLKGNNEKEDDIIDVPEEITNPEEFDVNDESGVDIGDDFELEL